MDLFDNVFPKPNPTPQWLKDIAIEAKGQSYCCPKCGEYPPDDDEWPNQYFVEDDNPDALDNSINVWPISFNHYSYSTDMGSDYGWTEYHKCQKCKTIYWFINGT